MDEPSDFGYSCHCRGNDADVTGDYGYVDTSDWSIDFANCDVSNVWISDCTFRSFIDRCQRDIQKNS